MMIACSLRCLVALLTAGLFASRLNAQEPIAPQPVTIEGAAAHVYKSIDGIDLRLHVFAPAETKVAPRAAIVFFFGGGWTGGTVQQFVPQAKHLAQRGMVAVVADYRVAGRHKTTPFAAMADAKSAIRWVRSHAKELGVDPSRIAGAGGSSGGHIAASAAVFDAYDETSENARISSKPSALVLFNPALDTSTSQNRFGARALEGSVSHHLKRAPPPTIISTVERIRPCRSSVPKGSAQRRRSCAARARLSDTTELRMVSSICETMTRRERNGIARRCSKQIDF